MFGFKKKQKLVSPYPLTVDKAIGFDRSGVFELRYFDVAMELLHAGVPISDQLLKIVKNLTGDDPREDKAYNRFREAFRAEYRRM